MGSPLRRQLPEQFNLRLADGTAARIARVAASNGVRPAEWARATLLAALKRAERQNVAHATKREGTSK